MKKKQTWDYDFECEDHTDYKMKFTFSADDKIFKYLFTNSILKLKKKSLKFDNPDMNLIEQFELEPRYLPLIQNFVRKPISITEKDHLNPDGIKLLSDKVYKVVYSKISKEKWKIDIFIKGVYCQI